MQEEFHFMQDKKRLKEIKIFLQNRCNLKKYNMEKLSLDGSSRQYYRIYLPNEDSKILLDDKNLENNSKEFALLSSFLTASSQKLAKGAVNFAYFAVCIRFIFN